MSPGGRGSCARRSTGDCGTCSRPTPSSCSARIRQDSGKSCCAGPLAPQGLFAVFQADKFSGAAVTMLPGLYLAVVPDSIDALLNNPPPKIRFFAGYSGWAPGQLRGELDRGDWLVTEAEADTVFLKDTSKLWQDMVRRASAVRADAAPMRW